MRSEVVFVQAVAADVESTISMLTPGRPISRQVVDNGLWTAVTVPPAAGRPLATALGRALDRTTFVITVGPDAGTLSVFGPDGQLAGQVDGRDPRAVTDLLGRWRFMDADAVAAALSSTAEPGDRVRQVAAAMRLPEPADVNRTRAVGLVVVERAEPALRGRLAAGGRGVVIMPVGAMTAVVADGSGLDADPVSIAESATATGGAPDRAMLVSWGQGLSIQPWGGAPGDPPLADRLRSGGSVDDGMARAVAVLADLGLPDVPVGASAVELATWAAGQPGAVRVPARPGGIGTVLPGTDTERVRAAVRHGRRLRRAQAALGVTAVAAGAGVAISWDEIGRSASAPPVLGLLAALLIVSLLLAALVGRRRRDVAFAVPARPRRRVPVAGRKDRRDQLSR